MPSSLRSQLDELASSFANDVLHAIRSASIEDLLAEQTGGGRRVASRRAAAVRSVPSAPAPRAAAAPAAGGRRRAGRLARRSAGDIAGVVESIVGLLRASPKGLRAEQIRQKLGFQSKELPRPLKEAVDAGRLGKSGQKRATTYFVKGAPAPKAAVAAPAGPGVAKKAAKKAPKKAVKKK
jgi:hypothetical protein